MLVIAGQVSRAAIGKNIGAVHEVLDQAGTVRTVTKWQRAASRPRDVPAAVTEAFRQMRSGRPRPVLIEMPPEAGVEREDVELWNPAPVSPIVPSPDQLREAARIIAEARLPLIYAGGGVARSDAEDALVRLAEASNIPVVTSTGGKGTIPDSHPLAYGSCFSPRGERQEMNQLFDVMQSADVVIGIGARFSLGNPAGNSSTLVNINVGDSELMRIQSNTIPLHGDARATIEALLPYLEEADAGDRPSPAEAVSTARSLIAYYDIGLHEPQYPVLEAIQGSIPEDAFIVWDVTQFGYYARTHYKVNHPKTYLDSGYQFNVGYSFPTALGVKVGPARSPGGLHGWRRRVPLQRVRAFHRRPARHQRHDRRLPERLLRQRRARPERAVRRNLRDRPAQPGPRQVRRVLRRGRYEGGRSDGAGNAAPGHAGTRRARWSSTSPSETCRSRARRRLRRSMRCRGPRRRRG